LVNHQVAVFVHRQGDGSDFQKGVGTGVEARRFNVNNDGQKAAKAVGHQLRNGAVAQEESLIAARAVGE
jgi:hypothetical protein